MRIDSLEESESNPNVDGKDVQVAREVTVQEWASNRACAKDEDLCRMCVFRGKTERCRIFVVDLVNMLVQWSKMQRLVGCRE